MFLFDKLLGGSYWSKLESDILKIKMKGKIGPTYAQEVHAETGRKSFNAFRLTRSCI